MLDNKADTLSSKSADTAAQHIRMGTLVIDLAAHRVLLQDQPIELAPLEFDLLLYLAHKQNCPVSCEELLHEVWKCKHGSAAQVNSCVAGLRAKLEPDSKHPCYIFTVLGFGYVFINR